MRTSDNSTVANEAKLVVESVNYTYVCTATNVIRRQMHTVMSAEVNFDTGIYSQLPYSLQVHLANNSRLHAGYRN